MPEPAPLVGAIRFDGSGHASRTSAPVSATTNFAIEAWFRYDVVPSGSQVVAYNGTSSTGFGIGFTGGKLAGVYGTTWLDSGQVPSAGVWHHVVLTRNTTTATIYLDGTAYSPTNSTATPSTPGANFSVGRQDATAGLFFVGDIDEVAVYNAVMTSTSVTAHWTAGRQTTTTDALTTKTAFDALGRAIETTDPGAVRTRFAYDRLGGLTSTTENYVDGTPVGESSSDDVMSTFGRNVLGELTGYCSAKNRWDAAAAFAVCDPTDVTEDYAWRYAFDDLGRMIRQTAPDNTTGIVADLAPTEWKYEQRGRLEMTCEDTDAAICGAPSRKLEYDQDGLGRTTVTRAIKTGSPTITTTTTYALDGQPATVAEGGTTMTFTYDQGTGLPNQVKQGATVETDYTWDDDWTLLDRDDGGTGSPTVSFDYDWAKRLTTITPTSGTGFGTSPVSRTYRLDGLLASQSWPNGESATLAYDAARRPASIDLSGGRSLSRAYDRLGNVTRDDRFLGAGVTGSAGDGELIHTYDPLGRVTSTTLDGGALAAFTYDRDGNRLTKTDGGTTYYATFDRTDAQATQKIGAGTPANLLYDASANLTTEIRAGGGTRNYTYDAANRLTLVDDPTGNDATLAYDPLARLRTRTVGSDAQTQSYVGTSELAWRQAGTVTTTALVDAQGARVGSKSGTTASWLVFDLLGSVGALEATGSTAISDALRYDAYGQTIGRYPTGGSAVPVRFRGLLDIAPTADPDVAGSGSDPLYLMGARMYSPHLGSFTALDTYAGDALNPLTMNRFLYALANPATMIDPTGHIVCTGNNDSTCDTYAPLPEAQQQAIQKKWVAQDKAVAKHDRRRSTTSTGARVVHATVPPPVRDDYISSVTGNDDYWIKKSLEYAGQVQAEADAEHDNDLLGGIAEGVWNASIGGLVALPGAFADDPIGTLLCLDPMGACRRNASIMAGNLFVQGTNRDRAEITANYATQLTLAVIPAAGVGRVGAGAGAAPEAAGSAAGRNAAIGSSVADDVLSLSTKDSWGRPSTLGDHFARHGKDFGAKSPDEYARMASEFLQRGLRSGTPTKIDPKTGIIRMFDPSKVRFGSYNPSGTTRTFYRPDPAVHKYPSNWEYWLEQPGYAP